MSDAAADESTPAVSCVLDPTLMNADTIADMDNIGLSLFAPLCGKNRGAFILDPPDGHTYGCISFPDNFAELAGVEDAQAGASITDSNAIPNGFADGTLSGGDAVKLLDLYAKSVYASSADVEDDPFGCDAGGLAVLECPAQQQGGLLLPDDDDAPVRAATLAGLFVPAPWATGGKVLTLEEATTEFYTSKDFAAMAALGLNAVQIPVPVDAFAAHGNGAVKAAVVGVLKLVEAAGLKTILVAVDDTGADDHQAAAAAAAFAAEHELLALTLPSSTPTLVSAARGAAPSLPLLVPTKVTDLQHFRKLDDNTYAAVNLDHATTVADVASSTSVDDRMKMFYHEATACVSRSPIEYGACYRGAPVFVSGGFDLSIDNCLEKDEAGFKDYGQCGRFDETVGSRWWDRHRRSFAARQLFAYERGAGWSFAAWKLYGEGDGDGGALDAPAKLLALKDVAAAGLMPSLKGKRERVHNLACLNGPVADFGLGDETVAPSPGPPPDCGNGWWNYETSQCDYWVPPEDLVENLATLGAPSPRASAAASSSSFAAAEYPHRDLAVSAAAGAAVALVLNALFRKVRGNAGNGGYATLP